MTRTLDRATYERLPRFVIPLTCDRAVVDIGAGSGNAAPADAHAARQELVEVPRTDRPRATTQQARTARRATRGQATRPGRLGAGSGRELGQPPHPRDVGADGEVFSGRARQLHAGALRGWADGAAGRGRARVRR